MRKLLQILLVLGIVFMIIGFWLSANTSFSKQIYISTSLSAAERFVFDQKKWKQWWPNNVESSSKKNASTYIYEIKKITFNEINVEIKKPGIDFNTSVRLLKWNKDSILVTWILPIEESKNQFIKFRNYFRTKDIQDDIKNLLQSLKTFLEKEDNIYGISIKQTNVTDTALISKRYSSSTYPSMEIIYDLLNQLRKYISKNNALQVDSPMLHVDFDSGYFKTMVAIPVNKDLVSQGGFLSKRMFPGKILVTEIHGGNKNIKETFKILELYLDDKNLNSPAIPFESLITNRLEETDTSKWKTKIYYPIY